MQAIAIMGIPDYVIRRCPVIPCKRTAFTVELAELIMSLMTSELGAGRISNLILKRRTFYWAASAKVYLEARNHRVGLESERGSLSSFGFRKTTRTVLPFSPFNLHCNGYGGRTGPSSRNIQRFFLAANIHLDLFADRFMMSLGGQVKWCYLYANKNSWALKDNFEYVSFQSWTLLLFLMSKHQLLAFHI